MVVYVTVVRHCLLKSHRAPKRNRFQLSCQTTSNSTEANPSNSFHGLRVRLANDVFVTSGSVPRSWAAAVAELQGRPSKHMKSPLQPRYSRFLQVLVAVVGAIQTRRRMIGWDVQEAVGVTEAEGVTEAPALSTTSDLPTVAVKPRGAEPMTYWRWPLM